MIDVELIEVTIGFFLLYGYRVSIWSLIIYRVFKYWLYGIGAKVVCVEDDEAGEFEWASLSLSLKSSLIPQATLLY